ncbi:hypothetical protein DFH07DRAFT_730180 [Mycena maculata]|uniref:DUF6818 domain-containing protein n=1 Tax=Mycena maculata TaxID=230809 RepID=A0AAD7K8L5_9AGAR|nr:hypothetical protein DFH07DRAFT_730180 [Mycena maculata]
MCQDQYQFSLRPVQASIAQHPIPIDPALISLPGGTDLDLTHGPSIAKAIGPKPAEKVAGSRRKGKERADTKGKKRQHGSSGSEDDSEPATKRGRPAGSGNYSKEDTGKLFDLIQKELPVGQKGWKEIHRQFNRWAVLSGRPKRSPKSLENKFKQYLKIKKPTGSATCPPEVKRAHELEDLINTHVGTRDLSDSEFDDDFDGASSNDDIEVIEHPSASVRTAVARRAPTPPLRRKSRASGADLANKLANAFDPETQEARDDARSQRVFENTQILTLSQQLRDAQAVAENLRTQNSILQNHVHDLERARDRAELKLELLDITKAGGSIRGRSRHRSRPRDYRSRKKELGMERVRGKIRCERIYPDCGAMTYWVSDPSTDDYEDENENPWDTFNYKRRSRSRHTTSHCAVSRRHTPTPGPSRIRDSRPSAVTGNAVELVMTPHRGGPEVALLISPAAQNNGTGLDGN